MSAITILLISLLFFTSIAIVILAVKNSVLIDKNKLYHEFTKRTSVKKFITTLDRVGDKTIDSDIKLMLEKYFELVLLQLHDKHVVRLLVDLDKTRHSGVLIKSLVNATVSIDYHVFGLALAASFDNPKDKLAIEYFLESLPEEQKKKQYQAAFNVLREDYDRRVWDYPSELRKPVEKAMKEFKEKFS